MSIRSARFYSFVALFSLALAASTGVLLRFGLLYGMPAWAQNYGTIRHAHSHLMYFGWGTLGVMALVWRMLPGLTGRPLPRGVHGQMALTCILSLLSFPAFWSNGYGLTSIGSAELPLGSMTAAANGLPWFLFAILYARATWRLPARHTPIQLWDWALVLLLLATAGALALGMQVALGVESAALRDASLHLFLDLFAVGWFSLAILGLLWASLQQRTSLPAWLPTQSLAILLCATFVLGMSAAFVTPSMFWLSAIANLVAALLLLRHLLELMRRRTYLPLLVWFALSLLAVHLLTAFAVIIPGVWLWAAGTQLRIFFLHNLLLGWMSSALLGLLIVEMTTWRRSFVVALSALWGAGVSIMLLALLGLGLSGVLALPTVALLHTATYASIGPALAATLAAGGMGWLFIAPPKAQSFSTPYSVET
jgi:hypothetical protein